MVYLKTRTRCIWVYLRTTLLNNERRSDPLVQSMFCSKNILPGDQALDVYYLSDIVSIKEAVGRRIWGDIIPQLINTFTMQLSIATLVSILTASA